MTIQVFFDGCCEPVNPGGTMGIGVSIQQDDGREIWAHGGLCEETSDQSTSNVAEYAALLSAIHWLQYTGLDQEEHIEFVGDSKLVINQMWGSWKIKSGAYAPLAGRAKLELHKFKKTTGHWIERQYNARADELSKQELRRRGVPITERDR